MREQELKRLPDQPGVYVMKDSLGKVLYVGKAKNIRKRVASYFNRQQKPAKIVKLVEKIHKVEPIVVKTETEALVLESELIKKYRPPFNVVMRDDKNYLYIRINPKDSLPQIQLVRRVAKDKAKYFGPYVNSKSVKRTIQLLQKIFPLCTAKRVGRACLNYHLGICPGVCIGLVSSKEYKKTIDQVIDFLSGKYEEVLKSMAQKMSHLSESKKFEQAARLRDAIRAIKNIGEQQQIVTVDLKANRDVIGLTRKLNKTIILLLQIRHGKLLHQQQYVMDSRYEAGDPEVIAGFLRDYYSRTQDFPKEVLLPVAIFENNFFEEWLSNLAGHKVAVTKPIRGRKRRLVDLAIRNAKVRFEEMANKWGLDNRGVGEGVEKLKKLLKLKKLSRIEAYDISNFQGADSVGSMVVFERGKMDKKQYRRFRIKGVVGPNDFASLTEILRRRFEHKTGDAKFAKLPDLILIDGGKGQVNAAKKSLGRSKIKIIGMAKRGYSSRKGRAASPTRRGPVDSLIINNKIVTLPNHSPVKYLLQNIRDEAHRFALSYHVHIRRKRMRASEFENIPGVGPATRRKLVKKFGSLAAVKKAAEKDIAKVVGKRKAEMVKNQL
ncbi:excinuclease ABC subunit C [candidate division Kazan bacterium]|uniref:UvrABC system protein C n=1 Tax=candidate division Kazan bacterium TaxID=2202143 RepID=A0A420ZDQ2_UNCK3|nr:MAG: excinuclease ABC subunit C [candidate division Kazan bacterium]